MTELNEIKDTCQEPIDTTAADSNWEIPDQDDRYPGSFFRVAGVPRPGKTAWSLN
jgi:hypothetical protein